MKRILITGANSYIGTSVEKWLLKEPDKYEVDTVDMRNDEWKKKNFSKYDVVFHVAGIAHIKETKENKHLYFKVNRDLAFETAKKAKAEGISQFVFLSSMSVYGILTGIITKDTIPNPKTNYGKSKFQAELLIKELSDDSFNVAIIRPPMVYGKGCKGNYPRLAKLAVKTPIFPAVDNKRSMIYIDNLSEFLKQLIDNYSSGLFFPQNKDYVSTSEMVSLIAKAHGKSIRMTKIFNFIVKSFNISTIVKVFGNLVYEKTLSRYESHYNNYNINESIILTEESGEYEL